MSANDGKLTTLAISDLLNWQALRLFADRPYVRETPLGWSYYYCAVLDAAFQRSQLPLHSSFPSLKSMSRTASLCKPVEELPPTPGRFMDRPLTGTR